MTYIERKALQAVELECLDRESFKPRTVRVKAYLAEDVDKIPAADVVKVVRCKDCKHIYGPYNQKFFCGYWTDQWDMPTELEGFCHGGEKRED